MDKYIAYCGLNCKTCQAYLATVSNNDSLRKKVADEWSRLNGVTITAEMINCVGCRTDGVKTPYCQSLCPIRQCALGQGIETCADCTEADICEKLRAITEHSTDAFKNLKGMHEG